MATADQQRTTRIERDSMGEMEVPAEAYYGASTMRAVLNFPISDLRFSRRFIGALGLIKLAAARVNMDLGLLDQRLGGAIVQAAQEVVDGAHDGEFVVDIFQTGSGTSTNTNANEVIANRATELLGGDRGSKTVHPNDHVNICQSSNDVIPAAMQLAALRAIKRGAPARAGRTATCAGGQGRGVLAHRQDRAHPPPGRHAHSPRPGVQGLRRPGGARPAPPAPRRGGAGRPAPRRHRRRHRRQRPS